MSNLKEQIQEVCYNYFLQDVFPTRKLLEQKLKLPFLLKSPVERVLLSSSFRIRKTI